MSSKGEIIIVTFPFSGHIFPATELATLLASRNYQITLLLPSVPSSPLHPLIRTVQCSSPPSGPPPGHSQSSTPPGPEPNQGPPNGSGTEQILAQLIDERDSSSPPLLCVIVDMMIADLIQVCTKRGVSSASLFTASACVAALEHAASGVKPQDVGPDGTIVVSGLPEEMALTAFNLSQGGPPMEPPTSSGPVAMPPSEPHAPLTSPLSPPHGHIGSFIPPPPPNGQCHIGGSELPPPPPGQDHIGGSMPPPSPPDHGHIDGPMLYPSHNRVGDFMPPPPPPGQGYIGGPMSPPLSQGYITGPMSPTPPLGQGHISGSMPPPPPPFGPICGLHTNPPPPPGHHGPPPPGHHAPPLPPPPPFGHSSFIPPMPPLFQPVDSQGHDGPSGQGQSGGPPPPPPMGLGQTDKAVALLFNTCDNLERPFLEYIAKEAKKPILAVGPLLPAQFWSAVIGSTSLVHDESIRSKHESSHTEQEVLNWLDSKPPSSVIYVSFGSANTPCDAELVELAAGLEDSNQAFIWVIQKSTMKHDPAGLPIHEDGPTSFNPNELATRVGERGRVICGWAPQLMILSHKSTGGFLTHCGWNSTVEALGCGVPMLTWPIHGDQIYNAKLLTKQLRVGHVLKSEGQEAVKREQVVLGIEKLMEDDEMRERVKEVSKDVFGQGFPVSSAKAVDAFLDLIDAKRTNADSK